MLQLVRSVEENIYDRGIKDQDDAICVLLHVLLWKALDGIQDLVALLWLFRIKFNSNVIKNKFAREYNGVKRLFGNGWQDNVRVFRFRIISSGHEKAQFLE